MTCKLEIGYVCKVWEVTLLDLNPHLMEWNQHLKFINGMVKLNNQMKYHLKLPSVRYVDL